MDAAFPAFAKYRSLVRHPKFVGWCAASLVVSGLLSVVQVLLLAVPPYFWGDAIAYGNAEWFYEVIGFVHVAAVLTLAVGMVGVFAVIGGRYGRVRRLAAFGCAVALTAGLSLVVGISYQSLTVNDPYTAEPLLGVLFYFGSFAGPMGLLAVGVAALWARGLGAARFLPLPASLLVFPFLTIYLLTVYVYPYFGYDSLASEVLFASPQMLSGVAWVVVGAFLFGARQREAKHITREREQIERTNLEAARRLYGAAWIEGDASVLEELVSPGVVDEYHGNAGIEDFRRNVSGLRRKFPDMDFHIERQSAQHDIVTTVWRLTGTDAGGLLYFPPTGERVTISGTFTDHFENGRLVRHGGRSDIRELVARLHRQPEGS